MARLRSVSVAQAKPPKATESRRGWAAALLRGRAPGATVYRVVIQLQTAALGVIGALVGYADFSKFALPLGFEGDRFGRSVKPMRGIRWMFT